MNIERYLPERPPRAETWTHLALAAAIWWLLYLLAPSQYTETNGPAGVITWFVLALLALALSITAWMMSSPPVQRAMLHLRWIVPIAFLGFAFTEKNRIDLQAAAELERVRALEAAYTASLAQPAAAVKSTTNPEVSSSRWPPWNNGLVSGPLPVTLSQSETLITVYEWEDGPQLRVPIQLSSGSTPDEIVQHIQRMLDRNRIPLAVALDEERRLYVRPRAFTPTNDRWFLGPELSESTIALPPAPAGHDLQL